MKGLFRFLLVTGLTLGLFVNSAQALRDGRVKRYAAAATLLAANDAEGVVAYALDTDALYLRSGTSWVAIGSGSGVLGSNGGTFGNETNNVWTMAENSEDLLFTFGTNDVAVTSSTGVTEVDFGTITLETAAIHANGTSTLTTLVNGEDMVTTGTANLLTMSSSTAATFAFTPATAVTGVFTPTGGVAASGGFTVQATSVHTGGLPARVSTDGTNAGLVATEYYISEVFVPANMSVTGVSLFNGATIGTDSVHAALADSTGAIVSGSATGAVALSGTDAYQRIPFTGGAITVVGPATYFFVFIPSGNTDKYNAHAFGDFRAGKVTGRTYGAVTSFTPPTTFTADLGPIGSLY